MRDFAVFILGACVGFGVAKLLQDAQEHDRDKQIDTLTSDIDEKLKSLEAEMGKSSA
jgi:hypothetical protein